MTKTYATRAGKIYICSSRPALTTQSTKTADKIANNITRTTLRQQLLLLTVYQYQLKHLIVMVTKGPLNILYPDLLVTDLICLCAQVGTTSPFQ